jgi:hypothetical protein
VSESVWDCQRWQRLYDSLEIHGLPAGSRIKALPRPSDEDLDRYERESGFRLPLSYRAFIKVFGPGELGGDFRLRAPGYPDDPYADLGRTNAEIRAGFTETFLSFFDDPERVSRMVFFCAPGGGDWIGWDPEDVRDAELREYGIYEIGDEEMEKVADSFPQFIEEVCLGPEAARTFDPCGDFSDLSE